MDFQIVRIFVLAFVAFVLSVIATPLWSAFLYRFKLGKTIRDPASAPIMAALHAKKSGTPTMGGVLIWGSTLIVTATAAVLAHYVDGNFSKLNFLSRRETWLPLFALIASAMVGLVDDYWNVRRIGPKGGGLRVRHRLLLYTAIAAVGAWWFYAKLEWDYVHIPFGQNIHLGPWFMLFFIFVIAATSFSVNETDGLDGLAGGTLSAAFAAFGAIAFAQGKYDLATFCAVIVKALIAFLWFNVNPARFFMGDTGSMALGVTLGVVAFLVNQPLLLPVIGIVFMAETVSVLIQLAWRKFLKRKLFRSTPLHHHLEAIGWPEPKVVMRLWILASVAAVIGLVLALLDKTF
jgi:phospho-N-acetylmuramoyl-pentapeptide-transferase